LGAGKSAQGRNIADCSGCGRKDRKPGDQNWRKVTMETAALIIRIALMLISVLLVVVVLLQKTKSSGLGASFGGETNSFTAKGKAASREAKLQKLTIILASIVGVLALLLTIF
jgi:preprotein translocase subunit SecG